MEKKRMKDTGNAASRDAGTWRPSTRLLNGKERAEHVKRSYSVPDEVWRQLWAKHQDKKAVQAEELMQMKIREVHR